MTKKPRNTWAAKARRTVTSVLPVDPSRRGECVQCGACCRLPNPCPFLKSDVNGGFRCVIYGLRPLNCRRYPRTAAEHITDDTCGFRFP